MRPYREFEVSFDSPSTGKKSRNVEISHTAFQLIPVSWLFFYLFGFVGALCIVRFNGMLKDFAPTAHVEVTSKELEKP